MNQPRSKPKRPSLTAWVLLALVAWLVAAYFALTSERGFGMKLWPASPPAPPSPEPPGTTTTVSSGPTTTASATATTSASAEPVLSDSEIGECVARLLPPATFPETPTTLSFLCTKADLRAVGREVSQQLQAARRGPVTNGMREWAGLRWYEMAAVMLLRTRCCSSPPAIALPPTKNCPMQEALLDLQKAFALPRRQLADRAVDSYSLQVRCLYQAGLEREYGQTGPPGAGRNTLYLFLGRVPWPP